MNPVLLGSILLLLSASLQATDNWTFSGRIPLTGSAASGVFHHLEGAGRKHIAVSAGTIAVTWEDNSSGDPQVYASTRKKDASTFTRPLQVSTGAEAYEPAIAGINSGFILAWEQDGFVHARTLSGPTPGTVIQLSSTASGQISLAALGNDIYCVWREQRSRKWNLVVARLAVDRAGKIRIASRADMEHRDLDTPILYPTLSVNNAGLNIAWEDRQAGHTRLKHSFSTDHGNSFSPPQYLNEFHSNRNQYDKGSGVTRVSLAAYGEDEAIAAWMDKRRGIAGYGIYASFGSADAFGPNEKVHGEKGDLLPHYNPSTAGNANGDFVIAWDDYRNGDSDIWISSYNEEVEWSQDYSPPPASGAGEQTHASVALDEQGNMHLLWIERQAIDAATSLWYSQGIKP